MNIAVTADGEGLDSQVSERFELCSYLLIVTMDDMTITVLKNDEQSVQKVLEYNCEAVITGNIEQTAFDILADAYITRYYGAGHSVREALELSEKKQLKLIKEDCTSHHHN